MTIIHETTEGERLARVEATVEILARDVRDLGAKIDTLQLESQRNFRWTVAILLGIFLPFQVGLLVSLITLILKL